MRNTPAALIAVPVAAVALIVAALALSAACGDDDGGPEKTPPVLVDTPSTGGTRTPTPATSGGSTALPTEPPTSDPTDPGESPPPGPTPPPADQFDYTSILQLVDKQHGLPSDYVPPGIVGVSDYYVAPGFSASIRSEAADALTRLLDDAYEEGVDVRVRSGYRSHAEQEVTFQYWVSVYGYEEALRQSAMAGYSEHQTGLAVDVSSIEVGWDVIPEFGATPESAWMDAHAGEYGFALSYPACCEATTGYAWEPWHWRYIGVDQVLAFESSGLTLNQWLANQ